MRIGVIGLGFMGSTHLQAWSKVEGVELVAVASKDEQKLAGDISTAAGNLEREGQAVDLGDAARYRLAEELIADPRVEAVDVCTPTWLHARETIAALEAGKHVLVEKPMALSGADCDRMIEASERAGRVLMVAQVLRFWGDYAAARRMIRSGELGEVKHAFFYRRCAAPGWSPWMREREKSGGGVLDLLIHDFDYCQHLFGKPASIEAWGVEELEQGIDTVEARLHYPGGPLVTVAGGWRHPKSYPFSMEFTIVCEGGTLDMNSALRPLTLYRADGEEVEVEKSDRDGFEAECAAFREACLNGEAPENCKPRDSAEAVRMALAMRESRDRGAPVEL